MTVRIAMIKVVCMKVSSGFTATPPKWARGCPRTRLDFRTSRIESLGTIRNRRARSRLLLLLQTLDRPFVSFKILFCIPFEVLDLTNADVPADEFKEPLHRFVVEVMHIVVILSKLRVGNCRLRDRRYLLSLIHIRSYTD